MNHLFEFLSSLMPKPDTTEPSTIVASATRRRVIRLRTLTRLRWFAVIGQTVVLACVLFGLGYELPVGPAIAVVAIGVWANLALAFTNAATRPLMPRELVAQLCFDTLQIGAILYLTGGIQNPFALWLILPAMLASSSLDRPYATFVVGMVVATLTVIALFHFPLPWSTAAGYEPDRIYDFGTWAALMLGVSFVSAYAYQVSADQTKLSSALDATQQVLAREERLTALGGLAAAAAHELGTPLGTIQVTAKEMQNDLNDGPLREDAKLLVSQTQRCQKILRRLSNAGESPDQHHGVLSLDEVLREAAKPFLSDLDHSSGHDVAVEFAFDPYSQTSAPERLRRRSEVIYGLRTLIENGVKFADETVRVTASWTDTLLTVTIEDDGPGFQAEVLTRLGEPYPRADAPRIEGKHGLGLGFFIAKTLLERTGAKMAFGNGHDLPGAWVCLTWPLANLRASPISREGPGAPSQFAAAE